MLLASNPRIRMLIANGAPVAIGVSGGKDSQAAALSVFEHLDRAGHIGPRILVHSDLGSVEWRDSLLVCRKLADHLEVDWSCCGVSAVTSWTGGKADGNPA